MATKTNSLPDELPAVPTFDTVCARLSLPIEAEETLADAARLQAEALSPFDEGLYTFSYEVLRRGPESLDVLVAAAADATLDARGHDRLAAAGLLGLAVGVHPGRGRLASFENIAAVAAPGRVFRVGSAAVRAAALGLGRGGGRPLKACAVLVGIDAAALLFVAGAVIGRAAVRANDDIVRIGQGLAADRTGTTGKLIHKSLRILLAW